MHVHGWRLAMCLALFAALPSMAAAGPEPVSVSAGDSTDVALTIYTAFQESQSWYGPQRRDVHFALVKDRRRIPVRPGVNWVRFTDVAASIEPASVSFLSLTDPGSLRVREQTYRYDLISRWSMLRHSIGKPARFRRTLPDGHVVTFEGTLLTPGEVIRTADGIVLDPEGSITLDEVPEGLIRRPELLWKLQAEKGGEHVGEVAYFAKNVKWRADYRAVLAPGDDAISLEGWVTVDNQSGASYPSAGLQLVAGDVHRAEEPVLREMVMDAARAMPPAMPGAGAPQFVEEPFFEYHLYTLQGRTTIADKETKQIGFLDAPRVQARKVYLFDAQRPDDPGGKLSIPAWRAPQIYQPVRPDGMPGPVPDGSVTTQKVRVAIEVRNSEEQGLGMPLPKGKVALYKRDAAGVERFVGEDLIDHTPKDEDLRLLIGSAFDVTGTRRVTSWRDVEGGGLATIEVSVRNAGARPVEVQSFEHLPTGGRITESSLPAESVDAVTARFRLTVPAGGEAKVTYTLFVPR